MIEKDYKFKDCSICNMCHESNFQIMGKRLNSRQGIFPRNKVGVTTTVLKCLNCGLIFSNPMPIPKSIQDHYGIPPELYWDKDTHRTNVESSYELINKFISLSSNNIESLDRKKTALDIGSGLGYFMRALENHNISAFGIEPSNEFYRAALKINKLDAYKFKCDTVENADYPLDFFDFISFGAVFEHLYDPSLALNKALGWAKAGALIHLELPNSNWLSYKIINTLYKLQGLDYTPHLSPMHSPFHLYEFNKKCFQNHYLNDKFKIIFCKIYPQSTWLPNFFNPILIPIMKYTGTGNVLEIWLEKTF